MSSLLGKGRGGGSRNDTKWIGGIEPSTGGFCSGLCRDCGQTEVRSVCTGVTRFKIKNARYSQGEGGATCSVDRREGSARFFSCPSWARSRTLLIQRGRDNHPNSSNLRG